MTDTTSTERSGAFEALADARRSVRRFSDAPVPEDVMRSALRSAHLAPSSNNLQPWEFHWVRSGSPQRAAAVAEAVDEATDVAYRRVLAARRGGVNARAAEPAPRGRDLRVCSVYARR